MQMCMLSGLPVRWGSHSTQRPGPCSFLPCSSCACCCMWGRRPSEPVPCASAVLCRQCPPFLQELHLALYLGDASLQTEVLGRCRQAGPACSPAPEDLMGLVEQHGALPDVSRQAHLLALDHLLGMGGGMPCDLVALVSGRPAVTVLCCVTLAETLLEA